jgi:hypothetical protein
MVKKKILKIINSSKIKINNFLNNKKVEFFDDLERETLKHKLITVSIKDYLERKTNTKNMMHSIMICIICMIGALRLLFGAFITDPEIWVIIADPFYLVGDRVLISITLIAFIVVGVKIRMICISRKYQIFHLFSWLS